MARREREQNRRSWNAATRAHNSHKGDQAAFLRRRGATTLFPEKLALLGPLRGAGVSDYVARSGEGLVPWGYLRGVEDFQNPHGAVQYAWGLAEIVQALVDAGLVLERLEEYPYANGCARFEGLRARASPVPRGGPAAAASDARPARNKISRLTRAPRARGG